MNWEKCEKCNVYNGDKTIEDESGPIVISSLCKCRIEKLKTYSIPIKTYGDGLPIYSNYSESLK